MAELAVRAADALELEGVGIDILFDEEGYRICEANSAPGFQGLERACAIDVPGAIFDWIEASQPAQARPLRAMTGEPLIDLVFGGRRPTATSNSSAASASSGGDPARSSARSMLPSFS